MNDNRQLTTYIYNQLQHGQSPDTIMAQLHQAGWPEDQIQLSFSAVQAQVVPTTMQTPATQQLNKPTLHANGKRRGKIKTGWQILTHCIKLLNGNRYLLRYYLMTWALVVLLNAAFIAFFWFIDPSFYESEANWYLIGFAMYLIIYCVINFYAAALARNILDIYEGQRKPYADYLRAARAKFWPIFLYSLISALIGIFLEYVIERLGWVGRIISWLIGTAWSVATMFTLPIIMDSNASAPSAIKQSWGLLKKTWGVGITAKVTAAVPIALLQFAAAFICIMLLWPVLSIGWPALVALFLAYIFTSITLAVIGSYASNFINAALYYYATKGEVPPGFDADLLNQVLVKSKRQQKKDAKQANQHPFSV